MDEGAIPYVTSTICRLPILTFEAFHVRLWGSDLFKERIVLQILIFVRHIVFAAAVSFCYTSEIWVVETHLKAISSATKDETVPKAGATAAAVSTSEMFASQQSYWLYLIDRFASSYAFSFLHTVLVITMATTDADDQSNIPSLRDLKDLKGFVDVDWSDPPIGVRKLLDQKVGGEGLIDIKDWWIALNYAWDRLMPVAAETKVLALRAEKLNSMYEKPRVTIKWTKWKEDELKTTKYFPKPDNRMLRDRDELGMRTALVKLALTRSLREEFNKRLRSAIPWAVGTQPEWQIEKDWDCLHREDRKEGQEEVTIDFP